MDMTEQRLVDLEMRVAFQEQALQELSDALAAARDGESRNALLLHRVLDEQRQLRSSLAGSPLTGDAANEPPPPHY
ncbi:MAG: SlyX family protein [Pseudomonadota bacterium]|nr:SlyX family protein [Pseudomonadota bacterium]MDQ3160333.1 SlyX family protein [Pseudomonadota bacterium]